MWFEFLLQMRICFLKYKITISFLAKYDYVVLEWGNIKIEFLFLYSLLYKNYLIINTGIFCIARKILIFSILVKV